MLLEQDLMKQEVAEKLIRKKKKKKNILIEIVISFQGGEMHLLGFCRKSFQYIN